MLIENRSFTSPVREVPTDDRLFPMPTGSDPTPYVYSSKLVPQDYFGLGNILSPPPRPKTSHSRRSSSAKATQPRKASITKVPYPTTVPSSTLGRRPESVEIAGSPSPISRPTSTRIPRKPIGSPIKFPNRRRNDSLETVIHSRVLSDAMSSPGTPVEKETLQTSPMLAYVSPSYADPFLSSPDPSPEGRSSYVGKSIFLEHMSNRKLDLKRLDCKFSILYAARNNEIL